MARRRVIAPWPVCLADMSTIQSIIIGTGSALPEKRLTNEDLAKLVDTNDEWITKRTGIKERRIVVEGETTATLATAAAQRALDMAGVKPSELDLIIVATLTPEMTFPATACFVAANLNLTSTPAFDVTAACCGFLYAFHTANAFIKGGIARTVLVIGAETLSRVTDYSDRGSCILFGDGAGAIVLQASSDAGRGLVHGSIHADGHGSDLMKLMPGSRHPLSVQLLEEHSQFMKIRGREVYKFAVSRFEELILESMKACELTVDTLKLIVPHQSNRRIIESAMEKLSLPMSKAYINIEKYGNTSAASIPIALDEANREGLLKKGDPVIMLAFGAGLTWGSAVVRW
jgi:3-oxoacyl-[acyl-carrier-protein] synthase III